ncbi:hypothetical protein T492DRAFT_844629 [Pavlovales sp. CCMP2436]|nr:hypothetical protein T492DRAFT_844629 [Pavlovales sp. CCMP2436]
MLFVGETNVLRTQEALGIPMSHYPQIYRPVVRVCGAAIIVNFQGIYGQAANGVTIDVVNSIERLESKVFETVEYVNLVSCTAATDSWLVTTDNASGDVQVHVAPAYSPTAVNALNKESPTFINNISIQTSSDWDSANGWRVTSSSTYQNNASFAANNAFDKNSSTYWASAEETFTAAGVGSQSIGIEYSAAVKLTAYRITGAARYPGFTTPTEWSISGSNGTTYTTIQTFAKSNWVANQPETFFMSITRRTDSLDSLSPE